MNGERSLLSGDIILPVSNEYYYYFIFAHLYFQVDFNESGIVGSAVLCWLLSKVSGSFARWFTVSW